ncbi:MAG TPA: hypothetical protein VHF67_02715 [Gaiellaceae bacterium]|nr:hypothetical protein [Gaiellaceae bacterium]
MSTRDPRRAPAAPALTALPRAQDLPVAAQGYDRARVDEAFDAFRRHVTALQAQLRVLQAAPRGAAAEPSGHAVRMDALHLIRAAAEFADTIERDAQGAATKQIARAEQEIRERQLEVQQQEAEVQRMRQETERQRGEIVNAARNEAREILARTNRESSQELREAEASGARLLEQARHQANELTNATRAEVEQTLEWARAQADVIVQRARMGAEQLLGAAGHGDAAVQDAVDAIVRAAEETVQASRRPAAAAAPTDVPHEPEPAAAAPRRTPARPTGAPAVESEGSGPGPVTAEPTPERSDGGGRVAPDAEGEDSKTS